MKRLLTVPMIILLSGLCWSVSAQTYRTWNKHVVDPNLPGAGNVDVGDIDDDGDLDAVAGGFSEHHLRWYENLGGTPASWHQHEIDNLENAWAVRLIDMDDDNDLDVVAGGMNAGVFWYRNDGGVPISWSLPNTIADTMSLVHVIFVDDLDGDGDPDVLAGSSFLVGYPDSRDRLVWYENLDGTAMTWAGHVVDDTWNGHSWAHTADIDDDGDQDILVTAREKSYVAWYENKGGALSWDKDTIDADLGWSMVPTTVDIDGDGDLDVVATGLAANGIFWYENDSLTRAGHGPWSKHQIAYLGGAKGLAVVNGTDFVVTGEYSDSLVYFERQNGTWLKRVMDDDLYAGMVVRAVDFEDDGDDDFFVTVYDRVYQKPGVDCVLWYEALEPNSAWGNSVSVRSACINPTGDSLFVQGVISNPLEHPVTLWAEIEGVDVVFKDSVLLFDDGAHGDGGADDDTCGGAIWLSGMQEGYYAVTLKTRDDNTGSIHIVFDRAQFTTAGPVVPPDTGGIVYGDYFAQYRRHFFKLALQNLGSSVTISGITATVASNDPRVESVDQSSFNFSDLAPGSIGISTNSLSFIYAEGYGPEDTVGNPLVFDIVVSADGSAFWTVVTDVEGQSMNPLPSQFSLDQNYPNPFNPTTTIRYELPQRSHVTLSVFNVLGQRVATLVDEVQEAGYKSALLDARRLASGVYFYRLNAGSFVQTRKMLIMK